MGRNLAPKVQNEHSETTYFRLPPHFKAVLVEYNSAISQYFIQHSRVSIVF